MIRQIVIAKIKRIIDDFGPFDVGQIEMSAQKYAQPIGKTGFLLALAQYFDLKHITIKLYNLESAHLNAIKQIKVAYKDLTDDELQEVLALAQNFEKINLDK